MVEVVVSAGTIQSVDEAKNEVRIGVDGWTPTPSGPAIDRRVDAAVAGTTGSLTFPEGAVSIESAADRQWTTFDDRAGPFELESGRHLVQVELSIGVYVAVTDPCTLSQCPDDGRFRLEFDGASAVTVGFRSHIDRPRDSVTVPRSLEGALAGVRVLSAAIDTAAPDKSYPTKRAHPPTLAFGDGVDVPGPVAERVTTTDITVSVPRSVGALLVTASLVYYLQAEVGFTDGESVRLDAPMLEASLDLGTGRSLEREVGDLLERVFYLDCLVRNAGPYGVDLRERDLLDRLDLNAAELYERSAAERLASYLRVDYAAVADRLPDWPLSTVVDPSLDTLRAVPYLLDRMSHIQLPDPDPVGKRALVSESVERAYAARAGYWGTVPTYDLVRNATRRGRFQGWMTDGTPVDAFRATLEAFEHRFDYHAPDPGPRRVVVVINDDSMLEERRGVERIYRSRSAELAIDVTVLESVGRAELADVFRSPVDFLHYIGHCDADGLRCPDGSLSTAELEATRVQTFFLNACGSFDQGLELVGRGSVAGAVTLANVLNPEASTVGMTFARLVMHGFGINYALSLASRQSLTSKFYTVVGDGTHRLAQGEDVFPADLAADPVGPDAVEIRFTFPQANIPGGLAKPNLPDESRYVLRGCPYTARLSRRRFVGFLANVNTPVVFRNEYHWSTDLAEALGGESGSAASA